MGEIFIYTCIFLYLTPYIFYPLTLSFFEFLQKKFRKRNNYLPSSIIQPFTLILTVHNEEKNILGAIKSILSVKNEFGADFMNVIIASDHCTDQTNAIVEEYADDICLVENYLEPGKTNAQLVAIETVDTDIVLITDCGTRYDAESVFNLLRVFNDEGIGGATGNLKIPKYLTGLSLLQNLHWMIETHIRRCQSTLGVLSTGTGAFLAFRRKYVENWSNFVGDDCYLPLCIVAKKARFVFVENAYAYDTFASSSDGEATARARMINRNLSETLRFLIRFCKQRRYALCINIILHKILRWMGSVLLICILSLALIFNTLNISIIVMYTCLTSIFLILIGYFRENVISNILNSFFKVNCRIFIGLLMTLKTQKISQYREKENGDR